MSKIVRLKTEATVTIDALQELIEIAQRENVCNFVFAAKMPNGSVVTS